MMTLICNLQSTCIVKYIYITLIVRSANSLSGMLTVQLLLCTTSTDISLRIDYCGFGPFCSTRTKLLLSFSLLNHILIKRQIKRLSNDISNIKMGKRMLLKINQKNEKLAFFLKLLANHISLNNLF